MPGGGCRSWSAEPGNTFERSRKAGYRRRWRLIHACRAALESWAAEVGADGLHERLAVLDPQAAQAIDPRNLRRTVRALEVIYSSGRCFSQQRASAPTPYRLLQVGLIRPRAELYERIDQRVQAMINAGLVEEVRTLLAMGYSPELPTLSAIGYGEISAYLQGRLSLDEAVAQIQRATRIFVRRQANWLNPATLVSAGSRLAQAQLRKISKQLYVPGWAGWNRSQRRL